MSIFSKIFRGTVANDNTGDPLRTGGQIVNDNFDLVVARVDSVQNLAGLVGDYDGQQISLLGWHPDSDVGGGVLYWDSTKAKADHNGGTVFSPTVPWTATIGDYLDGTGETDPSGNGCWVRDIQQTPVNIVNFGADIYGDNNSPSIIKALSIFDHVVASSYGATYEFKVEDTIELFSNKTLELLGYTRIKRVITTDETPVIWLRSGSSALLGKGSSSQILTSARCPSGVVRIGAPDMTQSLNNCNLCTIDGVWIAGSTQYGQTTGDNDASLVICNPEFSSLSSYFHTINNVYLANSNIGLWLLGWANANKISNIHFQRIGNETKIGKLLFINGALDNAIVNIFSHGSPFCECLVFEDIDNSSNGGFNHVSLYNSITNFQAEPLGDSSFLTAVNTVGSGNTIHGGANTINFGVQSDEFRRTNSIITTTYTKFANIKNQGTGKVIQISSGAVTIVDLFHKVSSESGVSDNLDTLNGCISGDVIKLMAENGHVITVRDLSVSGGNISLNGDAPFTLSGGDTITLLYDGDFLRELSRSDQ